MIFVGVRYEAEDVSACIYLYDKYVQKGVCGSDRKRSLYACCFSITVAKDGIVEKL